MAEQVLRRPMDVTPALPARRRPVFRRKRFFALALVVALGIAYLIVIGIQNASMYHLSVGELMARSAQAYDEELRVGGKVVGGSVKQDPATQTMRFMIADEKGASLPVVYRGVVPDAFKPEADVVLQGRLAPSGTFEATELLAKCPSKYVPEV